MSIPIGIIKDESKVILKLKLYFLLFIGAFGQGEKIVEKFNHMESAVNTVIESVSQNRILGQRFRKYLAKPAKLPALNELIIVLLARGGKVKSFEQFLSACKIEGVSLNLATVLDLLPIELLRHLYTSSLITHTQSSLTALSKILTLENKSSKALLPIKTPIWQLVNRVEHWRFILDTYEKIDQEYLLEATFTSPSAEVMALLIDRYPAMVREGRVLNLQPQSHEYIIKKILDYKILSVTQLLEFKELTSDKNKKKLCDLRVNYLTTPTLTSAMGPAHQNWLLKVFELNYISNGSFGDEYAKEFVELHNYLDQSKLKRVLTNLPTYCIAHIASHFEREGSELLNFYINIVGVPSTYGLKNPKSHLERLSKIEHETISDIFVKEEHDILCFVNSSNISKLADNPRMSSNFEKYVRSSYTGATLSYILALYPTWESSFTALLKTTHREISLR